MNRISAIANRVAFGEPGPVSSDFTFELVADGWDEDALADELRDAVFSDIDVEMSIVDQGIGAYEYWGSKGYDSSMGVDEVLGPDVAVTFSFAPAAGEAMTPEQVAEQSADIMSNLPVVFESRKQDGFEEDIAWRAYKVDGNVATFEMVHPVDRLRRGR